MYGGFRTGEIWERSESRSTEESDTGSTKYGGLYLSPRSKADFGTVEIAKEQGEFRASELTQTRCGITESEPFLRILGIELSSRVSI
ncbi:hypothetical protein TNCV_3425971 [Trichonephila clavipes]|nr:hypothetical protein TNCV_3425971 [Trichonephila clavipes]